MAYLEINNSVLLKSIREELMEAESDKFLIELIKIITKEIKMWETIGDGSHLSKLYQALNNKEF